MTTAVDFPVATRVAVLRAVAHAKYPREELPVIAHHHDLTVDQVKDLVAEHGGHNSKQLLKAAATLEQNGTSPDAPSRPDAEQAAAPPPQAKGDPYIAAIRVSDLFADPTYQRALDELRVARMATNYDIALVGIIEVSARAGGRYAILDGQHRWACVRDVAFDTADENPHVPCRVHQGLTLTEEAKLYHQLNTTRKQLTGWDRWLARRGANDQDVLDIEACAASHDLVVGMQVGSNVLRATKACENVVVLGGIPLLDRTFGVIRAAYRNDQNGLDASIVYGVAQILHAYSSDELDVTRLVDALSGVLPRQLVARAAAVRELHKGTMDRLTAHVVVEQYNSTKGPKLEAFFARVRPQSKTKNQKQGAEARRREAIRTWAIRQGLMTSPTGRIRKSVREAYDAAHAQAVS